MDLIQYFLDMNRAYKIGIAPELFDREIPILNQRIINEMAVKMELEFILEKDPEGNVCMANNKEVRPEFRQNFSAIDILNYIYALLHSSKFSTVEKEYLENHFPIPKNADIFWDLVQLGFKIKQIHSFQNIKTEDVNYDQKITIALSETRKLVKEIDKIVEKSIS